MKLWLLRPAVYTKEHGYVHGLWMPWYDKAFGFVIRAETEQQAREMAAALQEANELEHAWRDQASSTCTELTAEGPAQIVMIDFWRA